MLQKMEPELSKNTYVVAEMLIRKPVAEVFKAFVDPGITKNFWFNESSGRLAEGKSLTWPWKMFNYSENVFVKSLVENKSLVIEWGDEGEKTMVEWQFEAVTDQTTWVSIAQRGFKDEGAMLLRRVSDSTGGFTLVLAGLKAYLEHNMQLNLIADRFPSGH